MAKKQTAKISKDDSEEAIEEENGFMEFGQDKKEMHKTVCTECGKECEVPFKPEQGKSVYCKECYIKKRPKRGFDNKRFNNRTRQMYDAKCSACNNVCQVPFKPSQGKPILCKECYIKKKVSMGQ